MRKSLLSGSLLGTLLAFFALSAPTYAAVQNRINQAVTDSSRIPLSGTIHPRALHAADQGLIPSNRQLTDLTLRFNLTAAQEAALDQLLADQQNPASPMYHQWLTPEQFGAQFGVSAADLAKVTAWLASKGLTVTSTARSSNFVTFSGSAAQVQQAFGVTLHSLNDSGEIHFSNLTEPTVPSAISGIVSNVTGLNDFRARPRPHSRTITASEGTSGATPKYTSGSTGAHFIAPGDFYTIYDESPLFAASTPINGSGITIAVMGQVAISLPDAAAFRTASGLTANPPTTKLYGTAPAAPTSSTSTPSLDDLDESMLDVEWSGATAPSASILFVYGQDVFDNAMTGAITNNVAPIISVSYGNCESGFTSASIVNFQILFKQANAQGQTILGPAGDSGATDCDFQVTSATGGLAVDFPASSPNVTGVGGTMFNEGSTNYWNTSNNANGGSAMSYIPEVPWNETSTDGVSTTGAVIPGNIAGGGGGASSYFTKPAWQVGTGVPADFSRDVPDVAFNAAFVHDGYLFCSQSSCVNGGFATSPIKTTTCTTGSCLNVVGGTSVSTPSFAGILALVEQKTGSRLGNANPTIYALANSTMYSSVFHDITSGNNSQPCTAGSTNCPSGGNIGYNATTGFDLASGWGSVDSNNLVNDWATVTPIGTGPTVGVNTSTTKLAASATNVTAGTSITFTATVATGSTVTTTPTGTVQFLVDGTASGTAVALSSGVATFALATTSLASGAHTVTAVYSGDTVYTGSKSAVTIDITSATSADFSFASPSSTVTVKSGATGTPLVFTTTPLNGFTGVVNFSATSTANVNATYAFVPTSVTISGTTAATTSFTLYAYVANNKTSVGQHRLSTVTASNRESTPLPGSKWLAGSGFTLAALLLCTLPKRRRWTGLLAALLSVGILAASGCGGSQSTNAAANTNAATGTYSIQVTATSATNTALSHTVNVTFVVN